MDVLSQQVWSGLGLESEVSTRTYIILREVKSKSVGKLLYFIWPSALVKLLVEGWSRVYASLHPT